MKRLDCELQRLAFTPDPGTEGRTRAFTLSLAGPAAWDGLGAVWRGVQSDSGLPPPAIAVAGEEGYQLWFPLAEPLAVDQARAFAEALARRYLGANASARIAAGPLPPPPPREIAAGRWSAFVAPDLAALFTEETWLDLPPGWDVTLYYNDALVGYQAARPDGQYAFDDLPLAFGANEFRLVFHGPLGQLRVERQSFLLDQSNLKPGQLFYSVQHQVDEHGDPRSVAQLDVGLTSQFSGTFPNVVPSIRM